MHLSLSKWLPIWIGSPFGYVGSGYVPSWRSCCRSPGWVRLWRLPTNKAAFPVLTDNKGWQQYWGWSKGWWWSVTDILSRVWSARQTSVGSGRWAPYGHKSCSVRPEWIRSRHSWYVFHNRVEARYGYIPFRLLPVWQVPAGSPSPRRGWTDRWNSSRWYGNNSVELLPDGWLLAVGPGGSACRLCSGRL